MQYILNRLYEQPQPTIDEKLIEECISDIIHSEIDSYQQLYGMLTRINRLYYVPSHEKK